MPYQRHLILFQLEIHYSKNLSIWMLAFHKIYQTSL
nr:MAG TPA: hypothetical protein [Caudoviricetes sp.]DAX00743.1 MAG TPA: hypothetical protein [Bacteriophage sp.]